MFSLAFCINCTITIRFWPHAGGSLEWNKLKIRTKTGAEEERVTIGLIICHSTKVFFSRGGGEYSMTYSKRVLRVKEFEHVA